MKRPLISLAIAAFVLASFSSITLARGGNQIVKVMGDLRWGMSEDDVFTFLERKAKARVKRENRPKGAIREVLRSIRNSHIEFDGQRTHWDRSQVAGEYTHGNGESMIEYDDGNSDNYFFFINGSLWKWYKALDARGFGGNKFSRFSKAIQKRFGKGHKKSGERVEGQGQRQWIEFLDRRTRMRAVDNTKFGVYALVFEEMSTVRSLSSLRTNTIKRRSGSRTRVAALGNDYRPKKRRNQAEPAARQSQKRKSLFGNNSGGAESKREYEARKKKVMAHQARRQRRLYDRKTDMKKGNALKRLDGLETSDPLSGL